MDYNVIAKGLFGECSWKIDQDGNLSIFAPDNRYRELPSNDSNDPYFWPWRKYSSKIKSASVDKWVVAGESLSYMFSGLQSLENVDISKLEALGAKSMHGMFSGCYSLTDVKFPLNTSALEDISQMFSCCWGLTYFHFSGLDTRNVKNMSELFSTCLGLRSVNFGFGVDFKTTNVENMSGMFYNCPRLERLDLSTFDTRNVKDMSRMFYECKKLSYLDLSNFDTSKTQNMKEMFALCRSLYGLNIANFDISTALAYSNVVGENLKQMFHECTAIKDIDVSEVIFPDNFNLSSFLRGCCCTTKVVSNSVDPLKFGFRAASAWAPPKPIEQKPVTPAPAPTKKLGNFWGNIIN